MSLTDRQRFRHKRGQLQAIGDTVQYGSLDVWLYRLAAQGTAIAQKKALDDERKTGASRQ